MIKNINYNKKTDTKDLTQDLVSRLAVELEERKEMETTCPEKYCWGVQV